MIKKWLIMFLLVSLVGISNVYSANQMTAKINDFSGSNGDSVEAVVGVIDADNIGSMDMVITYDSEILVFDELNKGTLTGDSIIDYTVYNGVIKIIINDINGFSGDGVILNIFFTVSGQSGDTCTLSIDDLEANDATSFIDKLVESIPGQFHVEEKIQGTISCSTSSTTVNIDEIMVFSGSISPTSKNDVTISLTDPNGGLHQVSTTTDDSGDYSVNYSPMVEGTWEAVASWEYASMSIQSAIISFNVQQPQNGGIPGFSISSLIIGILILLFYQYKASMK